MSLLASAAPADAAFRAETPPDRQIATGRRRRPLPAERHLAARSATRPTRARAAAGRARPRPAAGPRSRSRTPTTPAIRARESQGGSVVWYRKDFKAPSRSRSLDWIVRFESIRYRADVYLNGKLMNSHDGGYLPFEVKLSGVDPKKTNRLVVRVDNRRKPTDLPPSRVTIDGAPGGGWWNYGGILADVYLRKVDRLDFGDPVVRPILPRARRAGADRLLACPSPTTARSRSRRRVETTLRRPAAAARLRAHDPARARRRPSPARSRSRRRTCGRPRDPFLYPVAIEAKTGRQHAGGLPAEERHPLADRAQRPPAPEPPAGQPAGRLHAPRPARRGRRDDARGPAGA